MTGAQVARLNIPPVARIARRSRGFVLLYTLVLLLALGTLLLGIQLLSRQQSQAASAQLRGLANHEQLESAAHELNFRLLQFTSLSPENVGALMRSIKIAGVDATVTPVDALLDLNYAAPEHVLSLLQAAGSSNAAAATQQLLRRRPIQTFASLYAIGLEDASARCVMKLATLSSGRPLPTHAEIDERLRRALSLPAPTAQPQPSGGGPNSPVATMTGLGGSGFRYWLRLTGEGSAGTELVVEVRVTGRTDQPIHILEWIWLPRAHAQSC